jgi:hypothetical protein
MRRSCGRLYSKVKKPSKNYHTSRQLRPLLVRLKRLTDWGLEQAPLSIVKSLDLRPRQPTVEFSGVTMWRNVRIGKIAGTFDVVLQCDKHLLLAVHLHNRMAMDEERAHTILEATLGSFEVKLSKSTKGWWTDYHSATDPKCTLASCFNSPTKTEKMTVFHGATIWAPRLNGHIPN